VSDPGKFGNIFSFEGGGPGGRIGGQVPRGWPGPNQVGLIYGKNINFSVIGAIDSWPLPLNPSLISSYRVI